MSARDVRRDGGFTLLETLLCVMFVGIIATSIAGVFTIVLRATPQAEARTDDARTLKGVVTWLPQDVDSTPPGGIDIGASTPSGCADSPGTNLLRLEWSENAGSGLQRFVANYRFVNVGAFSRIQRLTCRGVGTGSLPIVNSIPVSSDLPPLPAGWVPGQLPVAVTVTTVDDQTVVSFRVRTLENRIVQTDSAPKNPGDTLPPTTPPPGVIIPTTIPPTTVAPETTVAPATTLDPTAPTTIPDPTATTVAPTTTVTATTTVATLPPCQILTISASPTSVNNIDPNWNGGGNGKNGNNGNGGATNVGVLATAVTVTVTTAGNCNGLEARAATGAPNGELFRNFTANGTSYSVTFPGRTQGSSELWADGTRTITLYDAAGGPYGTVTFTVT